jgi:hypothetical protein
MESARIVIDTTRVERSAMTGAVTTGIELSVGSMAFPGEGWPDFSVSLLAAWADAASDLLGPNAAEREVHSTEGPYLVRLTRLDDGPWRLTLVDAFLTPRIRHEAVVPPGPLVDSIISASESVLELCAQRGWSNRDSIRLEEAIGRLRSVMSAISNAATDPS